MTRDQPRLFCGTVLFVMCEMLLASGLSRSLRVLWNEYKQQRVMTISWSLYRLHTLSSTRGVNGRCLNQHRPLPTHQPGLTIFAYWFTHPEQALLILILLITHQFPKPWIFACFHLAVFTGEVRTFTGFERPSGLCVANEQLLVADRGANEAGEMMAPPLVKSSKTRGDGEKWGP